MTPLTQRTVMKWLQMSVNVENQSILSSCWSLVELAAADILEVKFCQLVTLEDVMFSRCVLPY